MDAIWNWVMGWLQSLGLADKKGNIVILGLDNAGKTTLLYKLKRGRVIQYTPTQRPNTEEIKLAGLRLRAIDLGGHAQVRRLWREYMPRMSATIFVVDSADHGRLDEARKELVGILTDRDEKMKHLPIVILANKNDKPGAMSREQVRDALGLTEAELNNANSPRRMQIFSVSVLEGRGYEDAFRWLSNYI